MPLRSLFVPSALPRTPYLRRSALCANQRTIRSDDSLPFRTRLMCSNDTNVASHSTATNNRTLSGDLLRCPDGTPRLHVVFVHPCIHWNAGNIGRTCLGLGARLHLVGPLGFSLDAAQVRRAGLDYWQHVDLRTYKSWAEFQDTGVDGHAFFYTKFGDLNATEMKWPTDGKRPIVLVFGSEVNGFDGIREWLNNSNATTVAFPMVDERFRSFNLSTTASMALWDAYRSLACVTRVWVLELNVLTTSNIDLAHRIINSVAHALVL